MIITLIGFCFSISAQASDQWFGTVTFSKRFASDSSEVFPEGHSYHPGSEIQTERKNLSGSMRFFGDATSNRYGVTTLAHYTAHRTSDRKTARSGPCPWGGNGEYHDFETTDVRTEVNVNRTVPNAKMTIYIIDGKYSFQAIANGGAHQEGATKMRHRREWYQGCSSDPYTIREQKTESSDGMEGLVMQGRGEAPENSNHLSGTWSGKDEEGAEVTFSWDFYRKAPNVVARAKASQVEVVRGETMSLTSSDSKGNIEQRKWKIIPDEDCLVSPAQADREFTQETLTFAALCSYTAELEVSNSDSADRDRVHVSVKPRKGSAWKTQFSTRAGPPLTSRLVAEFMHLGVNQCSEHPGDVTSGHQIHSDSDSTWMDSGYTAVQLTDGGPFDGLWYVKEQALKISRLERINGSLMAGGELASLNASKQNGASLDSLLKQVRAHETAHSALVREGLDRLGESGDPASQIEAVLGFDQNMLQTLADMKVREVETTLRESTSEQAVKARLRSQGFSKEVKIWFPTLGGSTVFKDMGPLWGVGD